MSDLSDIIRIAGLIASVIMPLFNIPLVVKIWKRKSSSDISIIWVFGIWGSIILMLPAALISSDYVFRLFGVINFVLFSGVVLFVVKYR